MPMPRNEIIHTLDALAAPLGPQTSLDERLERQRRARAGAGSVRSQPPAPRTSHTSWI